MYSLDWKIKVKKNNHTFPQESEVCNKKEKLYPRGMYQIHETLLL